LLSTTVPVRGDTVTTIDLPAPGYWVIPPIGPEEITISFSGLSHFVCAVTAFQRYQIQNPHPPINFSFVS